MLAWFEAERKKRPRSPESPPNADGSENEANSQNKSMSTRNEGMSISDESGFSVLINTYNSKAATQEDEER